MPEFTSIYISGNLISYDLLERFDRDLEHVIGQKAKDFGFDSSANLRQETGRAWEDASRQWTTFKSRKERLKETDKGTTETRTHWMMPFFSILGYNPEFQKDPEVVGEKSYDISHRDIQRDNFPLLIMSFRDVLDKKPEGGRLRMSPHALLQDYLNNTEHTFGLVTNGLQLRLLRDTGRISKPVYAEFNLEKIFDESLYAEFVLLYRLLHASRMPQRREEVAESLIEQYHQDAIESGGRIRSQLSSAMEHSIKVLGKGLLQHPMNNELRQQIADGKFTEEQFYRILLRLIYRLLFLMTIEERRLVYPEKTDAETRRLIGIYDLGYSIERLRKLASTRHRIEGKQHDLWMRLMQTLRLYEKDTLAQKLGLHALGTGLFEIGAIEPFDSCYASNAVLLEAIFYLSYFENENRTMQRINYRQLDVEEFGSVYQGLLDYRISFVKSLPADATHWDMGLQGSGDRGKSGTHYTPEELVQPLIKHSLDYLIADRKKLIDEQIKSKNLQGSTNRNAREELVNRFLLTLKVCDVACGSGHILISAARRIAEVCAGIIEEEEQPNPTALRKAKREVIRQCIYGVDMNPMAVELCKVALWLEAHNPCEPLNFLDHHIKCGDAIVGLAHRSELDKGIATEAFKALPGDMKAIASAFAKKNKEEIKQRTQIKLEFEEDYTALFDSITAAFDLWKRLPEKTPEDIQNKQRLYVKLSSGAQHWKLKTLADMQVAQFFIPKTDATKDLLITDAEYQKHLRGKSAIQTQKSAKASAVAIEKKFFHWFIEFPEVFKDGSGFDCILGNPPFLGGSKLSGNFGNEYLQWLKVNYEPAGGLCDLVAYFFRRNFSVIKQNGFISLLATNSISQGDSREGGLDVICKNGGDIVFAIKSLRWPGIAVLQVSLISIKKGLYVGNKYLGNKKVGFISSLLDDEKDLKKPQGIFSNSNISYNGSSVLGMGFMMEEDEAKKILEKDSKNTDVLFPVLNGDDLNSSYKMEPSRWIINFFDWNIEKAKEYGECFQIVQERVLPERLKQNDKGAKEKWWLYLRPRIELYEKINNLDRCIAVALTSKTLAFSFVPTNIVFTHAVGLFASRDASFFCIIHSSFHYHWVWKYGSTMKDDLRYTSSDVFENFPFPQNLSSPTKNELEKIGEEYHEYRKLLMLLLQLGLTKTYNLFHEKDITPMAVILTQQGKLGERKYKEYLQEVKTAGGIYKPGFIEEAEKGVEMLIELRNLHKKMDEAVLSAYGWTDIPLRHDFYEVDYLPENNRIRYTIHPDARKEILKRLLELNHKIHDEEVRAGLWDKKGGKKKEILENLVKEPEEGYGMFEKEK
ncbi:MAG: Eco57I restriction-modification methylase domain-containing protein [Bacteroidia bacterium]